MSIIGYAQMSAAPRKAAGPRNRAVRGNAAAPLPMGVEAGAEPETPQPNAAAQGDLVSTYVKALTSLIPAEVLVLHSAIISVTTKTENLTVKITEQNILKWSFFGLMAIALVIYVGTKLLTNTWEKRDWGRMAIPPASFVGWTMLQKATAFDAVCPTFNDAGRTVAALFLAVILGLAATALAFDLKPANAGAP